ncbi:MAG TPA: response regulator, partial [Thermoanaerobaculia bacterium]|nr:response regulator [Thermoanaerobaculia bacterium]
MTRGRVVVVEDDPNYREVLAGALTRGGYEVQSAADGAAGLVLIRKWCPDAVLLDWVLPILDGGALTRAIKSDPALARVFVIIASARGEGPMRAEGIAIGADDYLVKPVDVAELLARLHGGLTLRRLQAELEEKNRELARLASTDPLTGLPNRRSFDANLERESIGAKRYDDALSLVLLDVDEFKAVNDRFGHDV